MRISPPLLPSAADKPPAICPSPSPCGRGAWPGSCSDGTPEAPTGRRSCFLRRRSVPNKTVIVLGGSDAEQTPYSTTHWFRRHMSTSHHVKYRYYSSLPHKLLPAHARPQQPDTSSSNSKQPSPKTRSGLMPIGNKLCLCTRISYRPQGSSSSLACEPKQMPELRTWLCLASKPAESLPKWLPLRLVCCSLAPTSKSHIVICCHGREGIICGMKKHATLFWVFASVHVSRMICVNVTGVLKIRRRACTTAAPRTLTPG